MTSLERLSAQEAREEIAKISGKGKYPRRRSKYNAVRTIVGEHAFHSKREAEAWVYLKRREAQGEIHSLKRQVPFKLTAFGVSGEPIYVCTYLADFQYFDVNRGATVTADSKGVRTALFNLKAKMVKACFGVDIEVI